MSEAFTMSEAAVVTQAGAPFAPRALVPISVGRLTVYMYPCIDSTMLPHERARVYHINLTALTSQNLDLRLQLDALNHQLNLQATLDGVVNDWLRFFNNHWCDFRHLTILSFHTTTGDVIKDLTTAADPDVLPPVQDRNIAQCWRPNIKFVRVQISLNFALLVMSRNQRDQQRCGRSITWSCRRLHE
jgi:hypothetical protein